MWRANGVKVGQHLSIKSGSIRVLRIQAVEHELDFKQTSKIEKWCNTDLYVKGYQ
jgi:hypothetical protein